MAKPKRTPREQLERAMHVSFKLPEQAAAMLDAYRDQVLTEHAGTVEALRARLWLIEQALTPIDISQDPAGIVGMVGPLLDGPLHPSDLADYRARTGQETIAPDEAEAGYVCGVCKDPECGHCLGCTCEACDEARKYAETLASAETWVLSAAQTRVANLPTNFSGSHIAASRLEVLAAITRIDKEF